jgi:hypothetical protein
MEGTTLAKNSLAVVSCPDWVRALESFTIVLKANIVRHDGKGPTSRIWVDIRVTAKDLHPYQVEVDEDILDGVSWDALDGVTSAIVDGDGNIDVSFNHLRFQRGARGHRWTLTFYLTESVPGAANLTHSVQAFRCIEVPS